MRVDEIRDRAAWQRLEPVWNGLLAESASASTFLTWEWLTAWWTAYGCDDSLRIVTVSDDAGVIRAIAPLRRNTIRRYGHTFRTLAFVGDGSNDSDYLDFIVHRGLEDAAMDTLVRHLSSEVADGVLLELNEIPASSPNLAALRRRVPQHLWLEQAVSCGTASLPASWDDYLSGLKPRFRTKIRSVLRTLEGREGVRFGFCRSASDLDRLLPALFDLHTRRWNHDGKPGVFGWDRKRRFYHELSPRLIDANALRFSWLEWNGQILACQFGFTYGTVYFHLQEGYEPAAEHWNVGIGLRAWSIREMIRSGLTEYDSLAGVGRHKTDWGATLKESRRLVVGAPTPWNRLFCEGPSWEALAKDQVRKVLPKRLLAARAARANGTANGHSLSRSEQIRMAAAKCYFHLGGPAVVRVLRSRYEAAVSQDGRVVRGSWARRRQPAGRILYYHRVNDDNDPFFPSLPASVFEGHMRHIARRYKVVSLAGLLDHLAGGSPESVVAITFDDGYRDNYEMAFPILQRYGLPATIFLTTGNIDSGDAPWFETLAYAVKHTSREFLDFELDLPRRVWLRTPEERLRANGELFAMLRRMPDEERKSQTCAILRELSPSPPTARGNLMLTWDQVRFMKARGVDFGGHTVTHPYLSRLTREQVGWEISECKRRIEEELQSPVVHFAYPNGREEDFAAWNKELLRNAGYHAAVTTMWGVNFPTTDRLELRRGGAWEQDPALFAYKMDWYQLVNG